MRKTTILGAALAGAALLSGCAGHRLGGAGADEFAVARPAPLVMPPAYPLGPPPPGAARPQDNNAQNQALDALFGSNTARSAAENGVVNQAGGQTADAGIRSTVGDPGTNVVDKGSTTRDIVAAPEGDGQDARASVK